MRPQRLQAGLSRPHRRTACLPAFALALCATLGAAAPATAVQPGPTSKQDRSPAPAASQAAAEPAAPAVAKASAVTAPPNAPAAAAVPAPPAAAGQQVSGEQARYYRRGLPRAQRFVMRRIAADRIDPADRGNETYAVAYDPQGQCLGYLRDFTGPVSPAAACPCSPLSLTLVFDAQARLVTLLSPQPLQKYGHAPMTQAETDKLLAILRDPPAALLEVERVEDMVDITTGATQQALADAVVPQAALSTRRLVDLVAQTQRILQGAPGERSWGRLNALVEQHRHTPGALCAKLSRWLGQLSGQEADAAAMRQAIWRALGRAYGEALAGGAQPDASIVAQLVGPHSLALTEPEDIAHLALRLGDLRGGTAVLRQADATLADATPTKLPEALAAQLRGTSRLRAGDPQQALPELQRAAQQQDVDAAPQLHQALAAAYAELAQWPQACSTAEAVFRRHPRLPGAQRALSTCLRAAGMADGPQASAQLQALTHALRRAERERFIAQLAAADSAPACPPLPLRNPAGREVSLSPADPQRITILAFFAAWCPHCRTEMPQLRAFVAGLTPAQRAQVRVVAVRTAKERETPADAAYAQRLAARFPLWADVAMSGAFAQFAQAHGLAMSLPTTAILDQQGRLRATVATGDYRDVGEQLHWALEALAPPTAQAQRTAGSAFTALAVRDAGGGGAGGPANAQADVLHQPAR